MEIIALLAFAGIAIFLILEGGLFSPSTTVKKIAVAIATAEGFYVNGSLPQRANNPGDLESGDIGHGLLDNKTVYASVSDGWEALYRQVQAMLNNSSAIYGPTWTIQDVANEYVSGQQNPTTDSTAWAQNVANTLGVDVDTQIGQIS
jgi:hypothetical protein